MKKDNLKFSASGALAGLANGLLGAGGGMFLVPLFCRWIKIPAKEALATSLAVIFPISIVSGVVYLIKNGLDFSFALPYLLGGLVGGTIGGRIFKRMSPTLLRRALAVFIIYGGVRALFAL